jgi:hypothetical protein
MLKSSTSLKNDGRQVRKTYQPQPYENPSINVAHTGIEVRMDFHGVGTFCIRTIYIH